MNDGFGSLIAFLIKDDAGVENNVGFIGAVRAGADNTGDLVFGPSVASVYTERMRLTSGGNLGIGTGAPAYKLDVNGAGNFNGNLSVTGNITASTGYKVGTATGLTASYNCTSYPNVTITGGIITSFSC
jgi:hypothetical protein